MCTERNLNEEGFCAERDLKEEGFCTERDLKEEGFCTERVLNEERLCTERDINEEGLCTADNRRQQSSEKGFAYESPVMEYKGSDCVILLENRFSCSTGQQHAFYIRYK